jgi:Tat protein secretion system quality control protein TatD with DNase activity
VQRFAFDAQIEIAAECGLPLFLHNRNARGDFGRACAAHRAALARGGGSP